MGSSVRTLMTEFSGRQGLDPSIAAVDLVHLCGTEKQTEQRPTVRRHGNRPIKSLYLAQPSISSFPSATKEKEVVTTVVNGREREREGDARGTSSLCIYFFRIWSLGDQTDSISLLFCPFWEFLLFFSPLEFRVFWTACLLSFFPPLLFCQSVFVFQGNPPLKKIGILLLEEMASLDITRAELAFLVMYLNKAETRDKICRAIQYGSKFISNGEPGVAAQVDKSTSLARKVFRLAKVSQKSACRHHLRVLPKTFAISDPPGFHRLLPFCQ